jgi:hypothetical protein
MVPPLASPISGPGLLKDRAQWSCGRQYAWRPTAETSPSAKTTIHNLEKTIKRIDDALQNDLHLLADADLKNSGKIQYDKIAVLPLKRPVAKQFEQQQRLSPKPFPRSSSFFGDRAKSVVHPINQSAFPVSSGFAERACSAPPAPPRLQNVTRYTINGSGF